MAERIKVQAAASGAVPEVHLLNEEASDQLKEIMLPCDSSIVEPVGLLWLQPIVVAGKLVSYKQVDAPIASKPSTDSVRVLQVRRTDVYEDVYIAVEDDFVISDFTAKCNECCGSIPSITAPSIPAPFVEDQGCADENGDYTYYGTEPENENALKYTLFGTFNGADAPAAPDAEYDDMDAILTWVQANWNAAGNTWSLVDIPDSGGLQQLKLVTSNYSSANIVVGLKAASYCLDTPTPAVPVDAIVIGSESFSFPEQQLDRDNITPLLLALRNILVGTVEAVELAAPNDYAHIQYTGLQKPVKLTYQGADVASFTSGVCS